MYPELFRIGEFPLTPYGLLVAAGFVGALLVAARLAAREGVVPAEQIYDFGISLTLAAIIGGKLFLLVTDPWFRENPLRIFSWEFFLSAGVFYGGFLCALAYAVWAFHRRRLPGWHVADLFAPAVPLGHALGRLGCFTAGCCHGGLAEWGPGVIFTDPACLVAPELRGIPLHPVQLYEAGLNLAMAAAMWVLFRRRRFDGQVFLVYLAAYGVSRFGLEFLRGDERGWVVTDLLSTSQLIAGLLVVAAITLYVIRRRASLTRPAPAGRPAGRRR